MEGHTWVVNPWALTEMCFPAQWAVGLGMSRTHAGARVLAALSAVSGERDAGRLLKALGWQHLAWRMDGLVEVLTVTGGVG